MSLNKELSKLEDLKKIVEDNKIDFNKLYKKIIIEAHKIEYSRGGEMSVFGIYPPEFFSKYIINNYKPGRKVKNTDKGFDFVYYFDKDNNLILTEKWLDKKIAYLNFVIRKNTNESNIIIFEKRVNKISRVVKCQYDENNRIIRYIENRYPIQYGINHFREIEFTYMIDKICIQEKSFSTLSDIIKQVKKTNENYQLITINCELVEDKLINFNNEEIYF